MKKLVLSIAMVAIGTFAMAQESGKMQKMDPAKMEQKRADKMEMMKKDLNLSDAQVAKIKTLQDAKMAQRKADAPKMQAERKANMEKMKAKKEEWNKEMQQILTPEQYQKWESTKKDKMHKKSGKMHKSNQMMQAN